MLQSELSYHKGKDGMMYPDLKMPDQTHYPIGKYGDLRLAFLKEHRKATYTTLLTQCKLNEHLHEIELQAKVMLSEIMTKLQVTRGVNEELKATDQLRWVAEMNAIRQAAEETVMNDLIYS